MKYLVLALSLMFLATSCYAQTPDLDARVAALEAKVEGLETARATKEAALIKELLEVRAKSNLTIRNVIDALILRLTSPTP